MRHSNRDLWKEKMKKTIIIGILLALCVSLATSIPASTWFSIGYISGSSGQVFTYYDSEYGVVVYASYGGGLCAVKVR